MRKLILTKSPDWISELRLKPYVILPNKHFRPPVMTEKGKTRIPKVPRKVSKSEYTDDMFSRGSFAILNLREHRTAWVKSLLDLASNYRYKVYWVGKPSKILDDKGIEVLPSVSDIREELKTEVFDFSKYRKVHHFGDLHGCYSVLKEYFDRRPFKEDELYIFLGDYIDRGVENGKLMKFLLSIYDRDNVIMLQGNHDRHLWSWSTNRKMSNREFLSFTKEDLKRAKLSKKSVVSFFKQLREAVVYTYGDKRVIATHGGLVSIPENMSLVSSRQLTNGVGGYETEVDRLFHKNTSKNEYQVHGHRNLRGENIAITNRTFNLEGQVEYGGELRVTILDKSGFRGVVVPNDVFVFDSFSGNEPIYRYGQRRHTKFCAK